MHISVVIPVYGCRAALPELHRRLTQTLCQISKDYEIILVNDSCPQNSWESIEELCAADSRVKGINLSRNFGQIPAITSGLDYCTGDWVVVMDCDLQDRPEEILNLYKKAQEGYDVVFARRKTRKDAFLKVLVSKIFYKVYSFATNGNYDSALCNFSICRKIVIQNYCRMREMHRAYVIYLKWLGFKQTSIDVAQDARMEGKSSYSLSKRLEMAYQILTSQSDKLLRLTVSLGFFITALSFVYIIWLIIHYFVSNTLPGWSSTIASVFFMGGIILVSIGIVGSYVGNTFMQSKGRPLYVVRDVLNGDHGDSQPKGEDKV